jgi:hypothetical protein
MRHNLKPVPVFSENWVEIVYVIDEKLHLVELVALM